MVRLDIEVTSDNDCSELDMLFALLDAGAESTNMSYIINDINYVREAA